MKTIVAAAALALGALTPLAFAHADPAYPIKPGYWEATTTFLGLVSNTDRLCIQPKDISKFLSGPNNHIYHCTYPENVTANGQLRFKGTCNDKHGYAGHLEGDGQYTTTTVHMNASGAFKYQGIMLPGSAAVDGHFVSSDCPADAKTFSSN